MSPRRYPSRPDDMPAPESVYRTLQEHDDQLDTLEQKIDALGKDVRAEVRDAVRDIKLSNSSETRKLIAAIAGTALTLLGGIFGAAKLEHRDPPAQIPRSVLDIKMDACRTLQPGSASRLECVQRVALENP